MLYQRTVKRRVWGEGVGLHSGQVTEFTICPAPVDSGIVFIRTDLCPPIEIPAKSDCVVSTCLATTLGKHGATVQTVEHLIAALAGLGIDNARIEIDGPEVPILDGSAAAFVDLIRRAGGTVAQRRLKRFLMIRKAVTVKSDDGTALARLEPAPNFQLRCTIDFEHPLIRNQTFEWEFSDAGFVREIAKARTFGFGKDVDAMHEAGLARGGSLDNAVVIDDYSIRNPEGLRYTNEFVRHKILDAIGDLALLGAPIIGRYVGVKSGHSLNTQLARAVLQQSRAMEYVEFRQRREAEGRNLQLPVLGIRGLAPA